MDPLLSLLKQGLTPSDLARSLAAGTVIACFPILGTTTLLCALVAPLFRLNMVAIQIANYAAYPLQFLFLIPFYAAGNQLFAASDSPPLSVEAITTAFQTDFWAASRAFGATGLRGVAVWCLVGLPAYGLLAWVFRKLLDRAWKRLSPAEKTPTV